MYVRWIKRALDFLLSLLALLVLSPVLLLIVLAIKLDSRGPVLFRQKRVGKDKALFNILKFRTMRVDTPKDVPTHLLEDPARYITRMGSFLRRTSFDELPQLWNILVGQMSIIGPRPALYNQNDLIALRDRLGVNGLLPGLTGYAQVNGRDELPIPIKAHFDGYYAEHISFRLDVQIFFRTVANVFTGSGVVEGRNGVMLETERLLLRQLTDDDFPDLCEMLQNPAVMVAYEGPFSDQEAREWLEKQKRRYAEEGIGLWAVILKKSGELIGQAGLTYQDIGERDPVCETGYLFKETFWHQGYATEAASACRDYAFDRLKYRTVYAVIRESNDASRAVAQRLGMERVGYLLKHYRGVDMPHEIYAIHKQ